MTSLVERAALEAVERAGEGGAPMGSVVDELVGAGFEEGEVEGAIWQLLQARRLTPHGFVARVLRRGSRHQRVYEFVLIPWSAALDRQLDMRFSGDGEP